MNKTINLYGSLARKFEKKYNYSSKNIPIEVTSGKEMIQALESNFRGFRQLIKKSGLYKLVKGVTLINGKNISKDELEMNFSKDSWHLMPISFGSSGAFQAIFGAVIFVVGVYTEQPWLMQLGAAMMLGGIAQMMSPNPGVGNYDDNEKSDERPSYLFDGPKNTVEPGLTIPVVYGEVYIGSISVSGGMRITDVIQ